MAKVQHTCTGCVPIDASIIDVYVTLVETNKSVTNAEAGRTEAEAARVVAETQRTATFATDHGRAVADHSIAQSDHATAGEDHTSTVAATNAATAAAAVANAKAELVQARLDTADADHTRAEGDHSTAVSDHSTASSDHTTAQSDHATAGTDHTRAESDHSTAASDHTASGTATAAATAAATLATEKAGLVQDKLDRSDTDHARAESDHSTAVSDHGIAGTDHTTATGDHATASADHTLAGADHTTAAADHTQAASDHTLAAADHTTAGADHTQALADHEVMEGYDTRLTNTETEVSQLRHKVDKDLIANYILAEFARGSLSNGVLVTAYKYRISSTEIISYGRDIVLTASSQFRFGIHYFENGVFVRDGGWQYSAEIQKGTTFKIVIARRTENTSENASITEFLSNVFVSNIIDSIEACEKSSETAISDLYSNLGLNEPRIEPPTRDGSKGNSTNAYAVVWLDIPCAGYKRIRFRLNKTLVSEGNIFVFCYTLPDGSYRDNVSEDIQNGFYQDSTGNWLELSCEGLQTITIQAYETSLPSSYPSTFPPLRKKDFLAGQGLQFSFFADSHYPEPMTISKRKVTQACGNQGLTIVGDTIVQFNSGADDHSSYASILLWDKDTFANLGGMTHNLGHAATIDYNSEIDALVVGNGTSNTSIAPRLDIVLGASSKIDDGNAINYNDADIIHIELQTAQKAIGGSGLICCFGGNWRELFLATGQNAPRKIFRCLLGVGNEDFSDQSAGQNDLTRWGTFISGKSNTEYNGTLKVLATYTGEETQVYQGMCYRFGFIYLACGYTQPLIHKIRLFTDGKYEITQTNLPQDFNADGTPKSVEPEGLCFYDDRKMLVGLPLYGGLFQIDAF